MIMINKRRLEMAVAVVLFGIGTFTILAEREKKYPCYFTVQVSVANFPNEANYVPLTNMVLRVFFLGSSRPCTEDDGGIYELRARRTDMAGKAVFGTSREGPAIVKVEGEVYGEADIKPGAVVLVSLDYNNPDHKPMLDKWARIRASSAIGSAPQTGSVPQPSVTVVGPRRGGVVSIVGATNELRVPEREGR